MANGLAVGGFFQGLGEGYDAQTRSEAIRKREEREEKESKVRIENAELDLKTKKDTIAAKEDFKKSLAALEQERAGGVTGEVVDQMSGQSLGNQTYFGDPTSAQTRLSQNGLQFRPETVKPTAPMGEATYTMRLMSLMNTYRMKTGEAKPEDLIKMAQFSKQLDYEGVQDAANYAFMNPNDTAGIAERFGKQGKMKIDPNMTFEVVQDPNMPGRRNLLGYVPGKDGKPQLAFDFNMIASTYVSAEARADIDAKYNVASAQIGAEKSNVATREKGATERVEIQERGANQRSADKNRNDREIANSKLYQERYGELYKMYTTQVNGIYKNAIAGLETDQRNALTSRVLSRAERLMTEQGKMPGAALDEAMRFTFQEAGIPLTLNQDKK